MRLQGVSGDDRPAFEPFVVARGPALVRFCHALCGDVHLAEDLVQEVLVKAHRRWDRIEGPPEPYVRAALCRELISWRRRRSAHERPGEVPDRTAPSPSDDHAQRDLVWRILLQLPFRQRAVLVLRHWEGLPDRETAAILGVSEATVRRLARRATARLRDEPALAHLRIAEGAEL